MKTLICSTISLILGVHVTCHGAEPPQQQFDALLSAHGTEYVKLRDSSLDGQLQYDIVTTKSVEAQVLLELLQARQEGSLWVAAFDRVVAEELQMRDKGEIDVEDLAQNMPSFCPLAAGIVELAGHNMTNNLAVRHIALAAFEYLWKVADEEYEEFNILRAFAHRDLMQEVRDVVLPQVALLAQDAESERVALEAVRLLHKYGLPSDDVMVIRRMLKKNPNAVKIRQISRAILKKHEKDERARALLKELDDQQLMQPKSKNIESRKRTRTLQGTREVLLPIEKVLPLGSLPLGSDLKNKLYESEHSKTNRITEAKQERIKIIK